MTFRTEPSSYLFSKLIRAADERRPDRVPRSGVPKGVGSASCSQRNTQPSGYAGALAQLGERLICIQEVRSSILLGSTKHTALE